MSVVRRDSFLCVGVVVLLVVAAVVGFGDPLAVLGNLLAVAGMLAGG